MDDVCVAGVDGCPGGWIAALYTVGRAVQFLRIARLDELFPRDRVGPAPALAAVDIPIGLPAQTGAKGRTPERLIRPLLGERQSSVFATPSRRAVYAGVDPAVPEHERYRRACEAARATSALGRAVAKQTFHLFPKIVEIDGLLRARPELVPRIHECHPELSFWAMNGGQPLGTPKKRKGRPHPPGLEQRRRLLAAHGFASRELTDDCARSLQAGLDDLIDACAAAWTAMRIERGEARTFPEQPEHDEFGLPVVIRA